MKHETINLFKKWTIVRPSCFAPKERSALKKKSSPIYLDPKNLLCNRINWVSRIEEQRIIKNNEEKNPKLLFVLFKCVISSSQGLT